MINFEFNEKTNNFLKIIGILCLQIIISLVALVENLIIGSAGTVDQNSLIFLIIFVIFEFIFFKFLFKQKKQTILSVITIIFSLVPSFFIVTGLLQIVTKH